MSIPVLLQPLQKLHVVLELALDKTVDGNVVGHTVGIECVLQEFVVVDVFVLVAGGKVDLLERDV